MGDSHLARSYRAKLERNLNELRNKWISMNNSKYNNYVANESTKAGLFSILGGLLGGLVAGPFGLLVGAALGGAGSGAGPDSS